MDRRKRKTRMAIRKACVSLIEEKGFEEMTILDITERADINRGTFYLHYVDKYDMLDQFEMELIQKVEDRLFNNLKGAKTIEDFFLTRYPTLVQIFDCFKENRDILTILFQTKGILSFQTKLFEVFDHLFHAEIIKRVPHLEQTMPKDLFLTIIVSLFVGFAQYFTRDEVPFSSEEMAKKLLVVLMNGPARACGVIIDETKIDMFTEMLNTMES